MGKVVFFRFSRYGSCRSPVRKRRRTRNNGLLRLPSRLQQRQKAISGLPVMRSRSGAVPFLRAISFLLFLRTYAENGGRQRKSAGRPQGGGRKKGLVRGEWKGRGDGQKRPLSGEGENGLACCGAAGTRKGARLPGARVPCLSYCRPYPRLRRSSRSRRGCPLLRGCGL